jgi:hypothetical protein
MVIITSASCFLNIILKLEVNFMLNSITKSLVVGTALLGWKSQAKGEDSFNRKNYQ